LAGAVTAAYSQVRPEVLSDISVNSVGFLPDLPKKASVKLKHGETYTFDTVWTHWETGEPVPGGKNDPNTCTSCYDVIATGENGASIDSFTVRRASDNEIVFRGKLGNRVNNSDTQDSVRVADFSALTAPGRYYVEARGSTSPQFNIAAGAFKETYRAMMLGMYLWRCGNPGGVSAEYNGKTYSHAACHTAPGSLERYTAGGSGTKDGSGGWHDAGDFSKYTTNAVLANGMLLKAWEHHGEALGKVNLIKDVKEGNIPAFLSEVKWNIDWIAKMQFEDGKVSEKLSTLSHAGYVMPEDDKGTQYFVSWSTTATAGVVAVLALASRLYEPYDAELAAKWLAQAKLGYQALDANPSNVAPNQSGFSTGSYAANDSTHRLWAAAEMWEATGDSKYLNYYEGRGMANIYSHLSWNGVDVLAAMTYLSSEKSGRRQSRVDSLKNNLISYANTLASNTGSHGYGRVFGSQNYYWGNHGALTANTYILNTAYKLTGAQTYRDAAHEVVGHILGRNYFGRSLVTGIGHKPPEDIHDRRSIVSSGRLNDSQKRNPWPGYIIGGPHNGNMKESGANGAPIAPEGATCATAGMCYFDYYADYARNEIAINWNASFIYALSGFVTDEADVPPSSILNRQIVKTRTAAAPKVKISRIIQIRNGKSGTVIPPGAKIYSLDGKLVAHRKAGDAKAPAIRRNGVFIMKADGK
jgi:endoglucanase